MSDLRQRPAARPQGRHRRVDRRRADRRRLAGALALDALAVAAAGAWWVAGRWPVALAWGLLALASAVHHLHAHRTGGTERGGADRGGADRPGRRRRPRPDGVSPAEVGTVLLLAAVYALTLRFGPGWGWVPSVAVSAVLAGWQLLLTWRSDRRDRLVTGVVAPST